MITHLVEELVFCLRSPLVVVLPLDKPFHDLFPLFGCTSELFVFYHILKNPCIIMVGSGAGPMVFNLELGAIEQGECPLEAFNPHSFWTAECCNLVRIGTYDLNDFIGTNLYVLKVVEIFVRRLGEVAPPYFIMKLKSGGGIGFFVLGHLIKVNSGKVVPNGGDFLGKSMEKAESILPHILAYHGGGGGTELDGSRPKSNQRGDLGATAPAGSLRPHSAISNTISWWGY